MHPKFKSVYCNLCGAHLLTVSRDAAGTFRLRCYGCPKRYREKEVTLPVTLEFTGGGVFVGESGEGSQRVVVHEHIH
jgi:hypothetical protein